ncbi:MAG: hypothetical protein AAF206_28085 [Bacteroidota bacterium]
MRNPSLYVFLVGIGLMLMNGCGCQGDSRNVPRKRIFRDDGSANKVDSTSLPLAICIYDKAGLRVEPNRRRYTKDGLENYITTVRYGEQVEMTGRDTVFEKGMKKYMFIRLKDGQEGWVQDYAFEKDAERGVMTGFAPLYRRPDMMTLRNDTLKTGDIIAVMEIQDKWLHVSWRNKWKKGWIQIDDNVSLRSQDVLLALLYHKAMQSPEDQQLEQLQNILNDDQLTGSLLRGLVEEEIQTLNQDSAEASNVEPTAQGDE